MSRSDVSPTASAEAQPAGCNPFIRAGSLKAWQEEQEKEKADQEESEKNGDSRSKSREKKVQ